MRKAVPAFVVIPGLVFLAAYTTIFLAAAAIAAALRGRAFREAG